jgi:nitrate reductase NapE
MKRCSAARFDLHQLLVPPAGGKRPLDLTRGGPMKPDLAHHAPDQPQPSRGRELAMFLFLTVVLAPVLAVAIVGGYGFIVWILQMIYGPPGPPAA